ncbi:MAG: cytochrome c [Candidatus Acidiferrales bacterium]|jgi:mono/diheme cytochrome c family protein
MRLLMIGAAAAFICAMICASLATADTARNLEEGERLFHARCGYCHLDGGTGTFMLGRRLGKDKALLEKRTDLNPDFIRHVVRAGIGSMPPHNRVELPDSELDLIAIYLSRPTSARESRP